MLTSHVKSFVFCHRQVEDADSRRLKETVASLLSEIVEIEVFTCNSHDLAWSCGPSVLPVSTFRMNYYTVTRGHALKMIKIYSKALTHLCLTVRVLQLSVWLL